MNKSVARRIKSFANEQQVSKSEYRQMKKRWLLLPRTKRSRKEIDR